MARKVFFSFAYDDVKNFKVNVVRHSWLTKNREDSFVDGSLWEKSKQRGDGIIKNLIDGGLNGTSVTAVLIGEDTANRRWVNYEIIKSFDKGNGLLAIHINRIRGNSGLSARGLNPLDRLGYEVSEDGQKVHFKELVRRKWVPFVDLPVINNKKSNSIFFESGWFSKGDFGKFFVFSEHFPTYCWVMSGGNKNFTSWIQDAAEKVGR